MASSKARTAWSSPTWPSSTPNSSSRVHDLTAERNLSGDPGVPYLIVDRSSTPPVARVQGALPDYAMVLVADLEQE